MKKILALDSGTTSNRAILFDDHGHIKGISQLEFTQHFPQQGWVEHNAIEIWNTQSEVARNVLSETGTDATEIAAIGITNQRETTIVWDRHTGQPVHHAIVWQDRRTSWYCDQLRKAGKAPMIQEKTGLVVDAYFSGTKLKWILDHVEGAQERAQNGDLLFGTVDTWLVWKLTGGVLHVTDVTNASRTMLYNINELQWDEELLSLFDIPPAMLPEVRTSSEVYGTTSKEVLGAEVPIAGIAGDQQAALFGQLCNERGMVKNTYGTGCFAVMNTGTEPIISQNNLLSTIAWQIGDTVNYALEGSVFIGGAVVQWLRDQLGIIESAAQVEALAGEVENNGGVYFVPAFVGLGAPHWDQYAAGTLIGLTRGSSKAHIARAALESICLQTKDVIDTMIKDSGITASALKVDGGAVANNLLMQIQADFIGTPVIRPKVTETTALGAAYLAGLAVGYWDSIDTLQSHWEIDRQFDPVTPAEELQMLFTHWKKALERSKNWHSA